MAASSSSHPASAAVAALARSAASEELLHAVDPHTAVALGQKAAAAEFALAEDCATLDTVYDLFAHCLALAGAVHADFEDAAAAARDFDDIDWGGYFGIAVAEAMANGIAAVAIALDEEPCEDKAMQVLERVGLDLDVFFTAHLFGELCRLELQRAVQGPEEGRLRRALQAICAWALASVGRVVGYSRFTGSVLWEWACGDAFWALVLAKGVLSIEASSRGQDGMVAVPDELANLQASVLTAVLEFASPGVVLSMEQGADAVPITVWNTFLAERRRELAEAMVCCKVPELLIAVVSRAGPSSTLGLASLFVSLLQPELALSDFGNASTAETMMQESRKSASLLAMELQRHAGTLWHLLTETPNAFGEYLPAQFLHDCCDLAYFVVPHEGDIQEFLSACAAVMSDPGSLVSLCFLAANAGLAPASASPVHEALAAVSPDARSAVSARFEKWRGPVSPACLDLWTQALKVQAPAEACIQQPALEAGVQAPARISILRELAGDAPAEFRCAIDGQIMMDPVQSPHGQVFERASLARSIGTSGRCPITGQPLWVRDCARVPRLRRQIAQWVREQSLAKRAQPQLAKVMA